MRRYSLAKKNSKKDCEKILKNTLTVAVDATRPASYKSSPAAVWGDTQHTR
jgi:hypothetical protein